MNRFLFSLLCACLLLTAVSCKPTPEPPPVSKTYEEQTALYDDIITQYTALLTAKHDGKELSAPDTGSMDERQAAIAQALYRIVSNRQDVETLGYGYRDLDGNGTPELFLLTSTTKIKAVFALSDDKPVLLEVEQDPKTELFCFAQNNRLLIRRYTEDEDTSEVMNYVCRVKGDSLVYDSVFGATYSKKTREYLERFRMVGNVRLPIDKESYNELNREHDQASQPGYGTVFKLAAPRIHFPLRADVSDGQLPLADFSSYDAIRRTYAAIGTCVDGFSSYNWMSGAYDDLFAFRSDRDFDWYSKLLYAASFSNYHVGYDEIDLNGDGQEELVLMNEDYSIKAIFTQKDGEPVLLDAFGREVCWLDEQGLIHVDGVNTGYTELTYSLYEFTAQGEYRLVYSILATQYARYLTKDGKTERISFEKSLELYHDGYQCYPDSVQPYEYTRNVSDLTYTPLVKSPEDPVDMAVGKTWRHCSDLEEATGKDLAHSVTFLSFENVTDGQMTLNVRYEFTSYYPNPEKDSYYGYLPKTTESSLCLTARRQDGILTFEEQGLAGYLEFGQEHMWVVITQSTDQRFPVGHHCYEIYTPEP